MTPLPARRVHRLDGRVPAHQRVRWRSDEPPVLRTASGDEIVVRVPDSSSGQLGPQSDRAALGSMDLDRVDAAVGPIEVEGAQPGDAVEIELRSIEPGPWGWSGVFRDFGLLRGRFEDDLVIWDVGRTVARPRRGFLRPVRIPVRPMLGWIGVAPPEGDLGMIPPRLFGGNLDNRLHRPGTRLLLPVQRPGGGILIGDPHAAQGDGEVCGTGIEVPATVRARISLHRGLRLRGPQATTSAVADADGPWWVCEGVDADPLTAARGAIEAMIERLEAAGARAAEAYLLLSVAGHLRWSEIVDAPQHVVSMLFPTRLAREIGRWPRNA